MVRIIIPRLDGMNWIINWIVTKLDKMVKHRLFPAWIDWMEKKEQDKPFLYRQMRKTGYN